MSFTVYDYRTDIRNVLVTSQIRSRFLRMEPGQTAQLHSHDLGHEIFLILEGRAEFEIDGETQELGPGQICSLRSPTTSSYGIALANQMHAIRVVGDEPMTMYLSVTPLCLRSKPVLIFSRPTPRGPRTGADFHTGSCHPVLMT